MTPDDVKNPDNMYRAPIVIMAMLRTYCRDTPNHDIDHAHANSMAMKEAFRALEKNGLITVEWPNSGDMRTLVARATQKGAMWVKYICTTPQPEKIERWEFPARV